MTVPVSHVDEALKLTADAEIVLYEIMLKNVPQGQSAFIRFRDGPMDSTTNWNSKTWEHMPCQFTGYSRSSDDERSRPTLRIVNPLGIFNAAVKDNRFDGALLQKYTVLKAHIVNDVVVSNNEVWSISRIRELISGQSISFELRALSDVPDQLIPARMFTPPDFPFVTL